MKIRPKLHRMRVTSEQKERALGEKRRDNRTVHEMWQKEYWVLDEKLTK